MRSPLAEIRDWLAFALALVSGYVSLKEWLRRRGRAERGMTVRVPAAVAITSAPSPALFTDMRAHGTATASLGLLATLDAAAELDPDFPQF